MEIVTDLIFLGSKITADGDCSPEIIRRLFLGRKAMTNLDRVLKSKDIILPTRIHIVMVFTVIIYDVRVGPSRRLSTEELMLSNFGAREDPWESCGQQGDQRSQSFGDQSISKVSQSPLEISQSLQSILKKISPGCSLEGISLKLKLQYFGQLMQRANSLEKTWSWERLRAKREEGGRGKYSITDSMDMSFSKLQELVKDREDRHVL